jgi:hypothetical protein
MPLTPSEQLCFDGVYFLIGAGASRYVTPCCDGDFDFPLGRHIFNEFIAEISDPNRIENKSLPERQRKWVLEDISRFGSIDELLHQASDEGYDELIECGRWFVDGRIYKAEAAAKCRHGNFVAPWVGRLMDFVTHGVNSYEEARERIRPPYENARELTFHTLNYDRVVEFSLLNYFSRRFPDSSDKLKILCDLNNEGVRHLHGGLGTLNDRKFGEPAKNDESMVRFWFEKSDKEQDWRIQNTVMQLRANWVFFGFGFHQQIISRMLTSPQPNKFYVTDANGDERNKIESFQSCMGLSTPQITVGNQCSNVLIERLVSDYTKGIDHNSY